MRINISLSWKLRSGVDDMHCSLTLDLLQVPAFLALEIRTRSTFLMITFTGILYKVHGSFTLVHSQMKSKSFVLSEEFTDHCLVFFAFL